MTEALKLLRERNEARGVLRDLWSRVEVDEKGRLSIDVLAPGFEELETEIERVLGLNTGM